MAVDPTQIDLVPATLDELPDVVVEERLIERIDDSQVLRNLRDLGLEVHLYREAC